MTEHERRVEITEPILDSDEDEEGEEPAINLQTIIDRIPWERLDQFLAANSERASRERLVNLIGGYILVGAILMIAAVLAWRGIIEGQALVGFLGAAIGYLLAKGRSGLTGGS